MIKCQQLNIYQHDNNIIWELKSKKRLCFFSILVFMGIWNFMLIWDEHAFFYNLEVWFDFRETPCNMRIFSWYWRFPCSFFRIQQGSHRLEKYLNLEGFLEKSLKVKYSLKSTGNHSNALKRPWIFLFSVGFNTVDGDLNQYKIAVPLFGAANATPNKGTTILYYFSSTNFSIISESSILK